MEKKKGLLSRLNKKRRIGSQYAEARFRRWIYGNRPVIGITGSVGKTTATSLLYHLVNVGNDTLANIEENHTLAIIQILRNLRPKHKRSVHEVSTAAPGGIERTTRVLRPNIGVIISVSTDHYSAFKGNEATAAEKGMLARAIPKDGLLLLNLDDEYVREMDKLTEARVVFFGQSEEADYQYMDVQQNPNTGLEFTVKHADTRTRFRIPVLGEHIIPSLLAAIACAHTQGVPWETLVERTASFGGVVGRCSIHQMPGRPVFIDDSYKAPGGTLTQPFKLLDLYDAPRKTIILGKISDYRGAQNREYRRAFKAAIQHADRVIFFFPGAKYIRSGIELDKFHDFHGVDSWKEVVELIDQTMIPDEVIFIKSSSRLHLERVVLNEKSPVECVRRECPAQFHCRTCKFLHDREMSMSSTEARRLTGPDFLEYEMPPAPHDLAKGVRLAKAVPT